MHSNSQTFKQAVAAYRANRNRALGIPPASGFMEDILRDLGQEQLLREAYETVVEQNFERIEDLRAQIKELIAAGTAPDVPTADRHSYLLHATELRDEMLRISAGLMAGVKVNPNG